jgi:hypothetical protein
MRVLLLAIGGALAAHAQFTQQLLLSSNCCGVSISADGNTAVVGQPFLSTPGAFVYTRSNGAWTRQGPQLVVSGAIGGSTITVAISGDGNTIIIGSQKDNQGIGAAWIFARSNGVWSAQSGKLIGNDAVSDPGVGVWQGTSVALSNDGNTAAVGGILEYSHPTTGFGAVWIYTRSNGSWSQQGAKLTALNTVNLGNSVALSADGNTLVAGDYRPDGEVLVFTRTNGAWQQSAMIAGRVQLGRFGQSVAITPDGTLMAVGAPGCPNGGCVGSVYLYAHTNGAWQEVASLVGTYYQLVPPSDPRSEYGSEQGAAVAISADGNTVLSGGPFDNGAQGAVWVFTRSNGTWKQSGNKITIPGDLTMGSGLALSADGQTAILESAIDNWVYSTAAIGGTPSAGGDTVGSGSGLTTSMTFTFSDTAGFSKLQVVDVLIASALDGRQACYVAFAPSGANSGSLFLVDDAGDAGGPYSGTTLPGSGTVQNSQCSVSGSASASGNTLTLTLNYTFTAAFAGNKVIYLSAADVTGTNSNWQAMATWNVSGASASGPTVVSMNPARTSSLGPTVYTFNFSDSAGFQDSASVENILVASAIDGRHACFLAFVVNGGALYLVDDAGDAAGPYQGMVLPSNAVIANSQCLIIGSMSSVNRNGNSLTLNLGMAFLSAFAGNQVFYVAARNSTANSGWQAVGSISVP